MVRCRADCTIALHLPKAYLNASLDVNIALNRESHDSVLGA
jgi:hypothetical protein